jgi:hypothetical protein
MGRVIAAGVAGVRAGARNNFEGSMSKAVRSVKAESVETAGSITGALRVAGERTRPDGSVEIARTVAFERAQAAGRDK